MSRRPRARRGAGERDQRPVAVGQFLRLRAVDVPAGIGAERHLDRRQADAGDLVAVVVDRRDIGLVKRAVAPLGGIDPIDRRGDRVAARRVGETLTRGMLVASAGTAVPSRPPAPGSPAAAPLCDPFLERDEQRPQRRRRAVRVARVDAGPGPRIDAGPAAMLGSGDQVDAGVFRPEQIAAPTEIGVDQRGSLLPILGRAVGFDDPEGARLGRQDAAGAAADRVRATGPC